MRATNVEIKKLRKKGEKLERQIVEAEERNILALEGD
jgi:hypothetical protein